MFTPGVRFLGSAIINTLPTVASVILLWRLTAELIPTSVFLLGLAAGLPLYVYARILCKEFRFRREAAAMGAQPLPRLTTKWPGNALFPAVMVANSRRGYPGKFQLM